MAFVASMELCGTIFGGEAGIRTLGGVTPTTVFETVPFNRSGTSPHRAIDTVFREERQPFHGAVDFVISAG